MKLEEELKSSKFIDESHKAILNVMFSASFLKSRIHNIIKNYELSPEQYNVLRILRGQNEKTICMSDIGSRMIDKNSNITRIMLKLVQKKLALKLKSTIDKREQIAAITKKGLQLLAQIDIDLDNNQLNSLPISEEEAIQLNLLLDKLRNF